MGAFLNRWLYPNIFPEDEEKNNRVHLLIAVILTLNLFALLGALSALYASFNPGPFLVVLAVLEIFNLASYRLVFMGKIRLVSILVLIETYIIPTLLVILR